MRCVPAAGTCLGALCGCTLMLFLLSLTGKTSERVPRSGQDIVPWFVVGPRCCPAGALVVEELG